MKWGCYSSSISGWDERVRGVPTVQLELMKHRPLGSVLIRGGRGGPGRAGTDVGDLSVEQAGLGLSLIPHLSSLWGPGLGCRLSPRSYISGPSGKQVK